VILLGEMRDLETISTALTAAETGHLVFATLHTQSAPRTIDRVIDVFPPRSRSRSASSSRHLEGVVTQDAASDGRRTGRVAALEILFPTTPCGT
jgi:twitching motility protein PilT